MASFSEKEPVSSESRSSPRPNDLEAGAELVKEQSEEKESPSSSAPNSIAEASGNQKSGTDGGIIEKIRSKASVNDVNAIPNGGVKAWAQVAGAFMLLFNTWGVVNTFGVYQTFYEQGTLFQASASNLSWVGAIEACLLLLIGALTGPIYDAGYFRYLIGIGSFLAVFGQMMLSLCTEYWQVLLAQGFCIGLGCGLMFIPGVAIISTYFTTKLAFAVGITASGSSLGGVIYPIVFHKLINKIGFGWTTRVIGFIMLITLIIPNFVMQVRVLPPQKRKLYDTASWKELPYVLFVLGSMVGFAGLYVPFFYVQFYAISTGITTPELGFYLLAILNSASVFGRIIPNFIADKTGPLNMILPCSFITAILIFALTGIHSVAGIVIFSVLYGFFSGTFVSIPPAIYVSLSPTRGVIGTRMGMGFSITALGLLAGTPAAGAILGHAYQPTDSDFVKIWVFGGTLSLAGAVLMILARFSKTGFKLIVKA